MQRANDCSLQVSTKISCLKNTLGSFQQETKVVSTRKGPSSFPEGLNMKKYMGTFSVFPSRNKHCLKTSRYKSSLPQQKFLIINCFDPESSIALPIDIPKILDVNISILWLIWNVFCVYYSSVVFYKARVF